MPGVILISAFSSSSSESYIAAPRMVHFIPVLSVADLRPQPGRAYESGPPEVSLSESREHLLKEERGISRIWTKEGPRKQNNCSVIIILILSLCPD